MPMRPQFSSPFMIFPSPFHLLVLFTSTLFVLPASQLAHSPSTLPRMRIITILLASIIVLVAVTIEPAQSSPASYFDDDGTGFEDYTENDLENILEAAQKRGCVRRGGSCDHRPTDCCNNSSCRCNLWGANCRCQRKGLFQKWGK